VSNLSDLIRYMTYFPDAQGPMAVSGQVIDQNYPRNWGKRSELTQREAETTGTTRAGTEKKKESETAVVYKNSLYEKRATSGGMTLLGLSWKQMKHSSRT